MNDSVVMDDGIGLDCFQLFGIELLDVSCFQVLEGDRFIPEIGLNGLLHHALIGAEGGGLHPDLDDFQPAEQIIGEQHIGAKLADLCGRLKGVADFHKLRFGFSFGSLFGKSGGYVLDVPLVFAVVIA